jgi:hypothetical protein
MAVPIFLKGVSALISKNIQDRSVKYSNVAERLTKLFAPN